MASQGMEHRTLFKKAAASPMAQRAIKRVRLNSPTRRSLSAQSAQTPVTGDVQGNHGAEFYATLHKRSSTNVATDDRPRAKRHCRAAPERGACVDAVLRCFERAERGGGAASTHGGVPVATPHVHAVVYDLTGDDDDDIDGDAPVAARPAWFVPPGVLSLRAASPGVLQLLSDGGGNEAGVDGTDSAKEKAEPSVEADPNNTLNGTVFLKWFLEHFDWE